MVEILPSNSSINDVFATIGNAVNQGFDTLVKSASATAQNAITAATNAAKDVVENKQDPSKVTNQDQPVSANQAILDNTKTFISNNQAIIYVGIGLVALGVLFYIAKKR